MRINEEALRMAMQDVKDSCFLTALASEEINRFINGEDIGLFSESVCKELSLLYSNIILPSYQEYTHGEYIPNIFVKLSEGELDG